jgi:hypothetical protein
MSRAAAIEQAYPRSRGFADLIVSYADRLDTDPAWLANVINFESGFSPSIRNAAGSGATGLIQFMPSTARSLGTTTDALARMTARQQMEYVYRYFAPYKGRLNTQADVMMAVYYPRAVGQGPSYSIYEDYRRRRGDSAAEVYLRQNAGIRTAGDYTTRAMRRARLTSLNRGGISTLTGRSGAVGLALLPALVGGGILLLAAAVAWGSPPR